MGTTDPQTEIVEVAESNLGDHPQAVCFINPKHASYHHKVDWLLGQFRHGLRICLLYLEGRTRPAGFIEFVPGEYCWRTVNAKGYLFIHCLWTNGKALQHQGLGSLLLAEAGSASPLQRLAGGACQARGAEDRVLQAVPLGGPLPG